MRLLSGLVVVSLVLMAPVLAAAPLPTPAAAPPGVQLQDLSSSDVQQALRNGFTTVLIPVGGVEQNGPHMALGKHNFRVGRLADRIASELGHTLVAPVVAYVPEGAVQPPGGHMRYAGTISIPDEAFRAVLDGAARSLAQHGFTHIVFIGDSGNYQSSLQAVAQRLNRDWRGKTARAHHIAAYYDAAQAPFTKHLRESGLSDAEIGTHAGAADTSLMLAVDPARVWPDKADPRGPGVAGDPRRASAALGRVGVDMVVRQAVAAIRQATGLSR